MPRSHRRHRTLPRWSVPIASAMLLLSSCGLIPEPPTPTPDEGAVQTRVAATLTAVAASVSPTVTITLPTPTDTLAPTATPAPLTATPAPTETAAPVTPELTATGTPLSATPTATTTPTPLITDWRGEYYATRGLAGAPAFVRNDRNVSFNWGQGSPGSGLGSDDFGARWTRSLDFEGATYRFSVLVDDGARLWVDNALLIDAWYDGGARLIQATQPLVRGPHSLRLEYYEHQGSALVELSWQKVESFSDWKGEYWPNPELSGAPALGRNDPKIDFSWGTGPAQAGLPADNFSARWTRTASFEMGTYRFHARVDDAVRIWVDNMLLLDAWYDHALHEVTVEHAVAKGTHTVRVEYYERAGGAEIRVWWEKVPSPVFTDWKAEYWSNSNLGGDPILVRNDKHIDFKWGAAAAAPGLPADNFSVRWTRRPDLATGVYRFSARADDGIRFYLDGVTVFDAWRDGGAQELYEAELTLAGPHDLRVEYYERAGLAEVKFGWTLVSSGPSRD